MIDERCSLQNQPEELERLHGTIDAFVDRFQVPAKVAYALRLATEELVTNIIKYGYDDELPHTIEVAICHAPTHTTVRIEDDGHLFSPISTQDPETNTDIEDRPIGGLGLMLVRNLVSKMTHHRIDNKNVVEIRIDWDDALPAR